MPASQSPTVDPHLDIASVTRFQLLRHGEPEGGARYRGSTDDPLTAKGWEQMRSAVQDCKPWELLVSSPLRRCADFAQELSDQLGSKLVFEEELREICFGEWEGKTADVLMAQDPKLLEAFWRDPVNNTPPLAEPMQDFVARVQAQWQSLIDAHRSASRVLVISHGGVIRAILLHLLGGSIEGFHRIGLDNGALVTVDVHHVDGKDYPRLVELRGQESC